MSTDNRNRNNFEHDDFLYQVPENSGIRQYIKLVKFLCCAC